MGKKKKIILTKKRIIDVQEGDDREENKRETERREGEGISQDKPQSRTVQAETISINRILIILMSDINSNLQSNKL